MLTKIRKASFPLGFALAGLLAGCALMSVYDPASYKTATDLKAQALILVGEATDPPASHVQEIKDVSVKLQQALEYEKGKGKPNTFTVQQWQKMADPQGGLLAEFLAKWQKENAPLRPAYIQGETKNISQGFDDIIKLENNKVKN